MSSELTDKQQPQQQQPATLQNINNRPSEPERLSCPRCDSTNTKFCYYNNYNLSQPRHFCKSCRRYWTRGGTLRNVPVGGGSRKRSRTTSPANSPAATATVTAAPSTSSSSSTVTTNELLPAKPVKHENGFGSGSPFCGGTVNLNETAEGEDFGSFFKAQQQGGGPFMPLGYFGYGSGIGTWDWPAEQIGGDVVGGENASTTVSTTWQLGCGESGGLADGDCYGWPDLAISAPGQTLK